jgi:hypothetical protein
MTPHGPVHARTAYCTQAEKYVAEGVHHVARQREIVAELANDGRDLRSAQGRVA